MRATAARRARTCALVGAADGGDTALSLACWGDNAFGQLGLSDRAPRGAAPGSGPAVVPLAPGRTVSAIAAGLDHTCGLLDDGTIRCWGDNRLGQLGVAGPSPASAAEATPVSVGASARALAAGAYHSCALLSTGDVSCWGWNEHGQLGDTDSPAGSVVAVNLGGQQAIAVTAGGFYSCAILQGGAVTCWGRIDAGQKPRPNPSTTETPILDAGTRIALGTGRSAREIVAGTSHACALLDDFSVKCWGFNGDGELGVGDTANRGDDETLGDGLPRVLLGGGPVSHLAGGARHTCAVQEAAVKCWGLNDSGRLGVGDQQNRGDDPGHSITAASFGGGGR